MQFGPDSVICNPALLRLHRSRRVLLLQGPVGAFFDRLAIWLWAQGSQVNRVAFQGGDVYDSQVLEPIQFKEMLAAWPSFLSKLLQELKIDCVVLFGQSRLHHKAAIDLCKSRGLTVVVLEEGYFRPGFITMELNGVNGFSETLTQYKWSPSPEAAQITPDISVHHFQKMALQASLHYWAMWKSRHDFIHYQHHRIAKPSYYGFYWIRSWLRKLKHLHPCSRLQRQLIESKADRPYYFVPLQHDGDAQITHHSRFVDNAQFVKYVIQSFAQHAPSGTLLVFRQHPHVRGGHGHSKLIARLSQKLGIHDRVLHMVEGETPVLAQHSAGVVLINSTVGLQALERGAPLMVLGDALYKQPHLTFTGDLDQFWQQARPASPDAAAKFLAEIKNLTQVPVSAYALRSEPIRWNDLPVDAALTELRPSSFSSIAACECTTSVSNTESATATSSDCESGERRTIQAVNESTYSLLDRRQTKAS